MEIIDIGCGAKKQSTATVGMDKRALPGVDVVHDLETFPWPVADGRFDAVIAWHVFEHLKPWLILDVMNECWRILKPDGYLHIGMPMDGFGLCMEPTHIRTWNEITPTFFDPDYDYYQVYQPKPWKILRIKKYTKPLPPGTRTGTYDCWKFMLAKRST